MINSYLWCPEQDSNLHASQHSHLKRARLPFRHLGIGVSFLVGQIYGVFGGYAIGLRIFSPIWVKKNVWVRLDIGVMAHPGVFSVCLS